MTQLEFSIIKGTIPIRRMMVEEGTFAITRLAFAAVLADLEKMTLYAEKLRAEADQSVQEGLRAAGTPDDSGGQPRS